MMDLQTQVKDFIETEGVQTSELVFYPPSQIVVMLEDKGINVNKMYIVRKYEELKIVFEKGLWVRKI